jgi:hypothetical protein
LNGKRIKEAFEQPVDCAYDDVPLRDVLDDISLRFQIMFDKRALEHALNEEKLSLDAPITACDQDIPLFAALGMALAPLKLACHSKYETPWVTTPDSDLFQTDRVKLESDEGQLAEQLRENFGMKHGGPSLQDVLDSISRRHHISIVNKANVNPPVHLDGRRMSLRSALGVILHEQDLYAEAQGNSLTIHDASHRNQTVQD